jgi:hypothetical protein
MKNNIYIPHIIDFRGRIYSNSLFSPIYNKILRPAYIIGKTNINKKRIYNSKYYKIMKNVFNFNNINEYFKIIIELEVGKMFIKDKLSISNYSIPITEIREEGIKNIKKNIEHKLKSHESVHFQILKNIYFSNNIEHIPCLLDSTASGQQVLSTITKFNKNNL